jgi:hypothetical protein
VCALAGRAAAQTLDAETLAQPQEGEAAKLDLQSLQRMGDVIGRFEVVVSWVDATRAPPADYGSRRVRYMTNCEEGTYTLVAVGVFDRSGHLMKTMVVPPGAADPVKAQKGTEAAKWVRQVCMF